MKSPDVKKNKSNLESDLYARSYSPILRVLIVTAIFLVAVFILVACGSTAKPSASSSPGNSSTNSATTPAVTPSIVPTTTEAGLTCNADKTSDSINAGKYFGDILSQVRNEWKADAVISSVRFERQYATTFQDLCTLKADSNWQMIFYSLSGKNEISGYLDNTKKDASGVPPVIFEVDKLDNSTSSSLTYSDMKKQGGWRFREFSRPETYQAESKYAANFFLGWKMSMSDVVQKVIDRVRSEKITSAGFHVYIGKASLKTKTPYVLLYWQNGSKKISFFVEPISLKTYDQSY